MKRFSLGFLFTISVLLLLSNASSVTDVKNNNIEEGLCASPQSPICEVDTSNLVRKRTKILIVPFNRFEFHTEFSLDEVANKNSIQRKEVFKKYKGTLLSAMVNYPCEEFKFEVVDQISMGFFMRRIQYKLVKKPSKHYASDLSLIDVTELQKIMGYVDAKYIVFINWYQIRPDKLYGMGGKSVGDPFSKHFVDFDVYNNAKQKVFFQHKFVLKNLQTTESISYKGLRVTDLIDGYKSLAELICTKLNSKSLFLTPSKE